jgi:5-formyltetrahydrofolate cyclo-ligase
VIQISNYKQTLRQHFRAQRRSLSQSEWQAKNASICQKIAEFDRFQAASVVLAFFSINNEPDLSSLWQQFASKTWGFPKTEPNRSLQWHKIEIGQLESRRIKGKYGIYEPLASQPLIDLSQVDLILVPTVACDRQGIRLGNGGGYYDRFFADLSKSRVSEIKLAEFKLSAFKLGITFELSLVDSLPREDWDIALDGVCTEFGIYYPN